MSMIKIAADVIGEEKASELEAMDKQALNQAIASASQAMREVQEELDANEKYQELKASKTAAESGKREVNKRQKGIIAYALRLLEGR